MRTPRFSESPKWNFEGMGLRLLVTEAKLVDGAPCVVTGGCEADVSSTRGSLVRSKQRRCCEALGFRRYGMSLGASSSKPLAGKEDLRKSSKIIISPNVALVRSAHKGSNLRHRWVAL